MVTAGPKTGFGLLPRDDGISFFNSQTLTSVTPIWDFQQQMEQDPQGRAGGEAVCVQRHDLRLVRVDRDGRCEALGPRADPLGHPLHRRGHRLGPGVRGRGSAARSPR